MKEVDYSNIRFIEYIKSLEIHKHKISISYLKWEDNNYFKELCLDDGGIIKEHLDRFYNFEIGKKISDKDELIKEILKYQKIPALKSINGNIKVHYDLHIWIKPLYIIYNAFFKKVIMKKMNIIDKIFYPVITPKWQNYYSEKQENRFNESRRKKQ